MHAEAMLLVDDDQGERGELDALLKQGMCADDDGRMPGANPLQDGAARLAGLPPGQQRHGNPQRLEPAPKILRMLVGQKFGRRHQRRLPARLHGLRRGQRRNQGLAAAHVALHQAQHRFGLPEDRPRSRAAPGACAGVNRNGSAASKLALRAPSDCSGQPGSLWMRWRSSLSDSWCASNSSNARRRCAGWRPLNNKSTGASAGGRCT